MANTTYFELTNNVIEKYFERIAKYENSADWFKANDLIKRSCQSDINRIVSDLWACNRMGFMTDRETEIAVDIINDTFGEAINTSRERAFKDISEFEYEVLYWSYRDGTSKEEAENMVREWWEEA